MYQYKSGKNNGMYTKQNKSNPYYSSTLLSLFERLRALLVRPPGAYW